MWVALCRFAPDTPPVPRLVLKGEEPKVVCDLKVKWPLQAVALRRAVRRGEQPVDVAELAAALV